ncbi:RNA polymerase largest subunit domain protein [Mollivirus kamchatka]|nr:RNA polymerase largest subunit domain protein [Mollivirus kamchatka]
MMPTGGGPLIDTYREAKVGDIWISRLDMCLVSPDEARRMSVKRIHDTGTHKRGVPVAGGLNDHLMGSVERQRPCATCHQSLDSCPGHAAHIDLNFPVYNYLYLPYVFLILVRVCVRCHEPLSANLARASQRDEAKRRSHPVLREHYSPEVPVELKATEPSKKEAQICRCCAAPQPKFKRDGASILAKWPESAVASCPEEADLINRPFTARDALEILEGIKPSVYRAMGFKPERSHPSWMITTVLAVAPPCMRPTINESDGSRTCGQDDVTLKIKNVLKASNDVGIHYACCMPWKAKDCGIYIPRNKDGKVDANTVKGLKKEAQERLRSILAYEMPGPDQWRTLPQPWREGSIAEAEAMTPEEIDKLHRLVAVLQNELATFADPAAKPAASAGAGAGTAKPMATAAQDANNAPKGIKTLMDTKNGLIRETAFGKRVDNSLRCVVVGDPSLDIDELGLPVNMCMELGIGEDVFGLNRARLQRAVDLGPTHPDGATTVTRLVRRDDGSDIIDSTVIHLPAHPVPGYSPPTLILGDKVERHLRDGDIIIHNRQPTLHNGSIMVHRVRRNPRGYTIGINPSVTQPYNADFDGDETNGHAVQDVAARADGATLMDVASNMVSPQANHNIVAPVQDAMLGMARLSWPDVFLTREQMSQMVMSLGEGTAEPRAFGVALPKSASQDSVTTGSNSSRIPYTLPPPAVLKPERLWTGKQLLSLLFPTDFRYTKALNDAPKALAEKGPTVLMEVGAWDSQRLVHIRGGDILCGLLCKQTLGTRNNSIVHRMWREYGPKAAMHFVSRGSRVAFEYITSTGFSVGAGDCLTSGATLEAVGKVLDRGTKRVEWIENTMAPPGASKEQRAQAEDLAKRIANNLVIEASKVGRATMLEHVYGPPPEDASKEEVAKRRLWLSRKAGVENNMLQMAWTGSKGTDLNFTQMCLAVGQQCGIEGSRMRPTEGDFTLPPLRTGGLVRATSAASRGWVSRPFALGLRAHEFFYHAQTSRLSIVDVSIKTAETGYMQRRIYKLGESHQVKQGLGLLRNSVGHVIQFVYGGDGACGKQVERVQWPWMQMSDEAILERLTRGNPSQTRLREALGLIRVRDRVRRAKCTVLTPAPETEILTPLDVLGLARSVRCKFRSRTPERHRVSNERVAKDIDDLCDECERTGGMVLKRPLRGMLAGIALLRSTLWSRRVVDKWRLSLEAWETLMEALRSHLTTGRHFAAPGEMVGILAGQCIGEPLTQLTLQTFHFAGVAAKNVTLGMPRLKEILDATPKMKKPNASVYLVRPYSTSRRGAEIAANALIQVDLADIVKGKGRVVSSADADMILESKNPLRRLATTTNATGAQPLETANGRYVRYVLDGVAMRRRGLSSHQVARAVRSALGGPSKAQVFAYALPPTEDGHVLEVHIPAAAAMAARLGTTRESERFEVALLSRVRESLSKRVVVSGIVGVLRAVPEPVQRPSWESDRPEEWMLDVDVAITAKQAFTDIMTAPHVDSTRTHTNNFHWMAASLGIEAASATLHFEIRSALCVDGSYIDERHIGVVADSMTYSGRVLAMSRNGINQINTGWMMNSSFEKTTRILARAATFGQADHVGGGTVSEETILGQTASVGSGAVSLMTQPAYAALWQELRMAGVDPSGLAVPPPPATTFNKRPAAPLGSNMASDVMIQDDEDEEDEDRERQEWRSRGGREEEAYDPVDNYRVNQTPTWPSDQAIDDLLCSARHTEASARRWPSRNQGANMDWEY